MEMGFFICESLESRHISLPSQRTLKTIYEHFQDPLSRKIYRHRLMYSLFEDLGEIAAMACESSFVNVEEFCKHKICLYGGAMDVNL